MNIVMVGNLSEGFSAVGPFDDFEDAADWADKQTATYDTWVMTVETPDIFFTRKEAERKLRQGREDKDESHEA